jgi:hypothetical protein
MSIATNFNIANLMKNSSAEERAIVYFNDLASLMTTNLPTLKDSERDSLQESFQTNHEIDVHNRYLCYFRGFQFYISEINHGFSRIRERKTALTGILMAKLKQNQIENEFIDGIYSAIQSDLVPNKNKEKLADMIESLIEKTAQLSIEEDLKRINSKLNQSGQNQGKNAIQIFVNNIKSRIEEELKIINHCQSQFRSEYDNFGVKFSCIENKIEENEQQILKFISYAEEIHDRFLKEEDEKKHAFEA